VRHRTFSLATCAAVALAAAASCRAAAIASGGAAGPDASGDAAEVSLADAGGGPAGPDGGGDAAEVSLADEGCGKPTAADGPAPADALADDAPVVACAKAQDCLSVAQASLSTFCCTDNACTLDTPGSCCGANVQLIQASSYDRSCTTDGDCMWVVQGNACHLLDCRDPGAINIRSYARYQSDLAKTRAASCVAPQGDCPQFMTCCRSGTCGIGAQCNGADARAE
jgi:hypothetical protein